MTVREAEQVAACARMWGVLPWVPPVPVPVAPLKPLRVMAHPLDDMTVFREYEPRECGDDGYPHAWHDLGRCPPSGGVKHLVRDAAGERCQRCGHPYVPGCGTWGVALGEEPPPSGLIRLMEDEPGTAERQRSARDRPPLWSPCDIECAHSGPYRWRLGEGYPWTYVGEGDEPGRIIADGIAKSVRIEAAWRILTVHHLNERKHDLRWWNLAALCQRCHLTIQRKVTMEDPWPWEHSEWFRPHAAAWYALRYRGEHLTYSQTLARLDELLALGREQEQVERMAL